MTQDADPLEQKLAALKTAFAASVPERIVTIEAAWAEFTAAAAPDEAFEPFFRAVHNLAGSCATYGFTETADRARALCDELYDMRDTKTLAAPDRRPRVAALVASLRGTVPG